MFWMTGKRSQSTKASTAALGRIVALGDRETVNRNRVVPASAVHRATWLVPFQLFRPNDGPTVGPEDKKTIVEKICSNELEQH
jgi:hypothetical protein